MDIETIDNEYNQLRQEFDETAGAIQTFAQKLQQAAQAGNNDARDWLLDLKEIAIEVKNEQLQVNSLLQALHAFVGNNLDQSQGQQPYAQAYPPQGAYAQQPNYQQQPVYQQPAYQSGAGGILGRFMGSGFGRAIEMGAGIGLGEDLINQIF